MESGYGERLRKLRGPWSQQKFADLFEISRSYYNTVEREAQSPSTNFLKALRAQFGVSVDWVLYGTGAPDAESEKFAALLALQERSKYDFDEGVTKKMYRPDGGFGPRQPGGVLNDSDDGRNSFVREAPGPAYKRSNAHVAELRSRAAMDDKLVGTPLREIIKNDALWSKLGPVTEAEFAKLKEFQLKGRRHRNVEDFFAALDFIRVIGSE